MLKRSLVIFVVVFCTTLLPSLLHGQQQPDSSSSPLVSPLASDRTVVHTDGTVSSSSSSSFPSSTESSLVNDDQDYETTVPVSIVITVDSIDFTLSLGEGARIRAAAKKFITERNLDSTYMEPIVNALIQEAKRVYESMQQSGTGSPAMDSSTATTSSSSSTSSSNIVATIDVNLNDNVYPCQVYTNETPQEAARRFCAAYNLAIDEEYDAILRLLVNRLRNTLGYTDNLPFTTDVTRTVTVVEVDTGDGTGRLLKLRVLEGETPIEAARGFLDRTGFDMGNLQALTQIVEQKMREQQTNLPQPSTDASMSTGSTGTTGTPSTQSEIISPNEGISLTINLDDGRTLSPLIYRYGQDPSLIVKDYLTQANLHNHNRFSEFVELITNGIIERVQLVQNSFGSVDTTFTAGSAMDRGTINDDSTVTSSTSSSTSMFMEQELPLDQQLINSPVTATVPLMVGEVTYDVAVTKGDNLRALARAFCRSEWEIVAPGLELALQTSRETIDNPDLLPLNATEDMCIAVVYDIAATYLGALAEEYNAQNLKDVFNPVLSNTDTLASSFTATATTTTKSTTTTTTNPSINLTGTVQLPQGAGVDGLTGSV